MLREVGRGPSLGSNQYGYPQSAGMTVSYHVSCKLNSICPTEPGFVDTFLCAVSTCRSSSSPLMACLWNVLALYFDSVYACDQAGAEMAHGDLINLVAWCKRERGSLQMQRA